MRGRSGPVTESKFALKTLKVSNDTLNVSLNHQIQRCCHANIIFRFHICLIQAIRAPIIWNRPTAGLFDYHYDVAGLYYQVTNDHH